MTSRSEATRERLRATALDLFEEHGYHGVTVEQIAAAAGVSHMTFFRHFGTKERVLLDDPFDPLIAEAVAAQPDDLPAVHRVARGMLSLTPHLGTELTGTARRAIAVAVGVPELEAGMAANTAATERAIVDRASVPGQRTATRIAAAACLAAITAAMLEWAGTDRAETLADLVTRAMTTVVPELAELPAPAGSRP
jgi:AcrR family transcriptional regulator